MQRLNRQRIRASLAHRRERLGERESGLNFRLSSFRIAKVHSDSGFALEWFRAAKVHSDPGFVSTMRSASTIRWFDRTRSTAPSAPRRMSGADAIAPSSWTM